MDLTELKKPLRALSLGIALVGLLILIVFSFIINDAMDKTRDALVSNLETIRQSMIDLEETLAILENSLNSADDAIDSLNNAVGPLSDGLESTADALESTGGSLGFLSFTGVDVSGILQGFDDASSSLRQSAQGLEGTVGTFEEQKTTLVDLQQNLREVKDGLKEQREALGETKKSVEDVFGLAKLANILFFFVIASMFLILILNSVAGLV